ncbi:MAG: hypothetical protein AB1560_11930 [Pseudomonadota bacterium]
MTKNHVSKVALLAVMSDGRSDYPLRPTQQLQIDFEPELYRSTSIVLFIARDGADLSTAKSALHLLIPRETRAE